MKKSRVLVVGAFPEEGDRIFGGIVTACRELLDSSFPKRYDLVLVDSTQASNPPPNFFRRLIFSFSRLFFYASQMRRFRPEAVLLFTSGGASLVEKAFMARVASLFGAAVLMFPRGGVIIDRAVSSLLHRKWIRWAFSGAGTFLCQGPAWQRFAVERLGFSRDDAPVINNWTATERLLEIGRERECGGSQEHPCRLLFLGWLEDHKGIFELLEACRQLDHEMSFSLTIAGRGNAEEEARSIVESSGLDRQVEFVGWVSGENREKLLRFSDILVLPSWHEGFPNAMIEAMAAGLAVVVSAVGNVPDVVTDGMEARLVPPRDVPALRDALRRMIDDREETTAIARRGHAFAAENYAVEPAVELLSRAIERAVKNNL